MVGLAITLSILESILWLPLMGIDLFVRQTFGFNSHTTTGRSYFFILAARLIVLAPLNVAMYSLVGNRIVKLMNHTALIKLALVNVTMHMFPIYVMLFFIHGYTIQEIPSLIGDYFDTVLMYSFVLLTLISPFVLDALMKLGGKNLVEVFFMNPDS